MAWLRYENCKQNERMYVVRNNPSLMCWIVHYKGWRSTYIESHHYVHGHPDIHAECLLHMRLERQGGYILNANSDGVVT